MATQSLDGHAMRLNTSSSEDLQQKTKTSKQHEDVCKRHGVEIDNLLGLLNQDGLHMVNPLADKAHLKIHLQSLTSHADRYLHAFQQEGVDNLQNLLKILRNKQESDSFSQRVKSRLTKDLKTHIEQNLNVAVDREEKGTFCQKDFLKGANLDVDKCWEVLDNEGVFNLFELKVVSSDTAKYDALLSKLCTLTFQEDLQEVFAKCLDIASSYEILEKLGLCEYFPEKITVQKVMEKYISKSEKLVDVPWFFLSKMLMVDHRGRDDVLSDRLENLSEALNDDDTQDGEDIPDSLEQSLSMLSDDSTDDSSSTELHPLDILTLVFQCCSNLLRQIICERMFMCKLGIPLVLPPFQSNMPLFLMWSLRGIAIEYHHTEEEVFESSVINCPSKVVSCIRLGKVSRSKSEFLNELVNGGTHDTFYHRNCMNGMASRTMSEGLIEIAWYIPSSNTKSQNQLNTFIAFVNHRGDGKRHGVNKDFLQRISDVVLVMVDVQELGLPEVMSSLKSMASAGAQLILMLSKGQNIRLDKVAVKTCVAQLQCGNFKRDNLVLDFTAKGEKNIKTLKAEVVAAIKKTLARSSAGKKWENYKSAAESCNIRVDENTPECLRGKKLAYDLIKFIKTDKNEIHRSEILPMQSESWITWTKLNKEEHRLEKRPKEDLVEYISSLSCRKIDERKKQLSCIAQPSKLFKTLLDNLQMQCGERIYYMKWLKLLLDDMSRRTIPVLQRQYRSKWDELCQLEESYTEGGCFAPEDKTLTECSEAPMDDISSKGNNERKVQNTSAGGAEAMEIDSAETENGFEGLNVAQHSHGHLNDHNNGTKNFKTLRTEKSKPEDSKDAVRKKLHTELRNLESKISEASLGLEHLVRESCQAYEAVHDLLQRDPQNIQISKIMKDNIDKLPQIMAELLLCGYPLEIMDGDASHVPLLWVKAVVKKLENLIGKNKIFVLSVLGIQSSGKSTLLNAMFGLQFAVAAGRCTRGVYAQLVPVPKENSDMKYDYILVVDTEGLRAPELGNSKLQHDNEIATLVLGLGDVTLINIKGENVSEMEDVLQVVVHALLKMKLVQKSLKLQPSCIFIHQNVGAQGAEQNLRYGQQRFLDTLDRVTEAAGQQEDAPYYRKFKQIIDFNINENIWYFSDLWKGDPPLAPVNPGYSDKVAEVKEKLLTDVMSKRASSLTISDFYQKLEDLWKGILGQNFVFCFKNSLEMKAYSSLETVLADLSWSLKKYALEWLNSKRKIILSQENEMEKLELELIKEFTSYLGEEYGKKQKELKDFFETTEEKELMEQWRVNTGFKLKECYETVLSKTKKNLLHEVKARKIQLEQRGSSKKYKEEIEYHARQFAENLRKEKDLGPKALEDKFYTMWDKWMARLDGSEKDNVDVVDRVMDVLLNAFTENPGLLRSQMEQDQMERIEKNFIATIEQHITGETRLWNKKLFQKQLTAEAVVKELIQTIEVDILNKGPQLGFNRKWPESVIEWIVKKLDEMKGSGIVFTSESWLKLVMSVKACKLASYKIFRAMNEASFKLKYSVDSKRQIDETLYEPFVNALQDRYSWQHELLNAELQESCIPLKRSLREFKFDMESHITTEKHSTFSTQGFTGMFLAGDKYKKPALAQIEKLFKKVQAYFDETEFHAFKDGYAETLIRYIDDIMRETESAKINFKFTKTFRAKMAIHLCQFAVPTFEEKHKGFMENTDPRKVFERNFKKTYFKLFKNLYNQTKDEIAFADVLAQQLSEAIESTVNNDLTEVLADDVRSNVKEVKMKPTFLKAVLEKLLDGSTDDILSYLIDLDVSFGKWVAYFVNNYLFEETGSEETSQTRYAEIASREIDSLIQRICQKIEKVTDKSPKQDGEQIDLGNWIRLLHRELKEEILISEEDLTTLATNFKIVDLPTFTRILKGNLQNMKEDIIRKFSRHDGTHLAAANKRSVYSIILEECTGCAARCPFCTAPCSRNNRDHVGMDHMAIEHYPDGCGGYINTAGVMGIINCSVLVTHPHYTFLNEDTKSSHYLYKDYKKVYPDWHIDADSSEEASPYWKWVVTQHAAELAKKFGGTAPNIPEGWKNITKEDAMQSLRNRII